MEEQLIPYFTDVHIERLHRDINYIKFTTTMIMTMMITYFISGIVLDVYINRHYNTE